MPLAVFRVWGARRFAKKRGAELYAAVVRAEALGDASTLKSLAADNYWRKAIKSAPSRKDIPDTVELDVGVNVRRSKLLSARVAMHRSPVIEHAQVLVLVDATHRVTLRSRDDPTHVLSEQTSDVREILALECDLLKRDAPWRVLDRLSEEAMHERIATHAKQLEAAAGKRRQQQK
eukprot:TRINITY_DN2877_c0_g1_i2.p3 TRINITY_DN2877_c0_g1~~TRINITY_DN2877_c0_g1_i2.p3  ORF type:complete len:176 (-),score=112.81 TRINITY_DN2877_c0_g1_i2:23-550(-)